MSDANEAVHRHIRPLPSGDLAIIGDVHGELGALRQLLDQLDPALTLVYVGDLADRGPDSPGVINLVQRQIDSDTARCVLGNHELSVLRRKFKGYNTWFFPDQPDWTATKGSPAVRMQCIEDPTHLERVWNFFNDLPVALERDDLRVVHAAWDDSLIDELRQNTRPPVELFNAGPVNDLKKPARYKQFCDDTPPAEDERDRAWEARETEAQNTNAIRYSTSGGEEAAAERSEIGWHGGEWCPLARDPWWKRYTGAQHVVIGHYSRSLEGEDKALFGDVQDSKAALGPEGRVWCVDYGIGNRSAGGTGHRLAALVWRDGGRARELVFHNGERFMV